MASLRLTQSSCHQFSSQRSENKKKSVSNVSNNLSTRRFSLSVSSSVAEFQTTDSEPNSAPNNSPKAPKILSIKPKVRKLHPIADAMKKLKAEGLTVDFDEIEKQLVKKLTPAEFTRALKDIDDWNNALEFFEWMKTKV